MNIICALVTALGVGGMLYLEKGAFSLACGLIPVVLLPLFWMLYKRLLRSSGWPINLFAALFSLASATGFLLDVPVTFADGALRMCVLILLLGAAIFPAALSLANLAQAVLERSARAKREARCKLHPFGKFLLVMLVILLAWLPVWLAYHPGFWNYDPWQVKQVATGVYSTNHPLIHTLLLGNCYKLGWTMTGSGNAGVMIYVAVQALIMSAIFSYSYLFICRRTDCHLLRGLSLAFYMLFPVNPLMVLSSTKDVIFSGLVLLTLVLMIEYLDALKAGKRLIFRGAALAISAILMLLFRNNAIAGFAGVLVMMLLFAMKRGKRKLYLRVPALLLACIVGFGVCNVGLTKALDARSGAIKELLSIPAAQFGRIYTMDSRESAAKDEMARYFEVDSMRYQPNLADDMKKYIVEPEGSGKLGFVWAWLDLVMEYPAESVDAFLYLNKGAWSLWDNSFAEVYGKDRRQGGYLQTSYESDYEIEHVSRFPQLESLYEDWFTHNSYQESPLLKLFFAPALYFWIALFCICVLLKKQKGHYAAVLSFLPFLYITILLGPCTIVRYMYPYMAASAAALALVSDSFRNKA